MKLSHKGRARHLRRMASRYNRPIPGSLESMPLEQPQTVTEPSVRDMLANGHELRVIKNEKKYDLVVAIDTTVVKTVEAGFAKQGDATEYGETFFGVKPKRMLKVAA